MRSLHRTPTTLTECNKMQQKRPASWPFKESRSDLCLPPQPRAFTASGQQGRYRPTRDHPTSVARPGISAGARPVELAGIDADQEVAPRAPAEHQHRAGEL